MSLTRPLLPALFALTAVLFAAALPWALHFSPADYQQGQMVRVMYVHVPAAWFALLIYAVMGGASLVYLVWRHSLADVAARAAAPIGAAYAALCLATGAIWGRPTWGTWWEWDARLTSMLILFLTYLGYMALRAAIENEESQAKLGAALALAGLINLPIIHYSVEWWSTLHQPASLFRRGGSAIHVAMLGPLLTMAGAYAAAFAALLVAGMRTEIYLRAARAARLRALREGA